MGLLDDEFGFKGLLDDDSDFSDRLDDDSEWLKEQEREREIASRPKVKLNKIDCTLGETSDEDKEASWLMSKPNEGISLNYDENGNYVIFLLPDQNSEAIILTCKSIEDVKRIYEKIILNLQIAETFGKKIEVVEGEKICIEDGYYSSQVLARRVTDEAQIMIDGKPLETTRDAGTILLEHANIGQNGEKVIDFQNAEYSDATHVCLMRRLYENEICLTEEQKKSIAYYKAEGFMSMNALLRGGQKNFKKILDMVSNPIYQTPIDEITKNILEIDNVASSLPPRVYDIVLHRKGSGVGKDMQVGSKNQYHSFVSFGTNEGMRTGESPEKYVEYQYRLKKDDLAIPVEILCSDALKAYLPECEIFTLPFSYEVEKYDEKFRAMFYGKYESLVVMGNSKNIPISKILPIRLQELRKYLEELNRDRTAVDDILTRTQGDDYTRKYEEQGYIVNTDVEQISLLEMLNHFQENGKMKDIIEFDSKIQEDTNQYVSFEHGANHTRRVGFFARVIGENEGLSDKDMNVLLYAVQNHDIGRIHDGEDKEHGEKSVEKLKQLLEENKRNGNIFSQKDMKLIYFLIENHSKSTKENEAALMELPEDEQDRYRLMLNCLKDADKLDRIRLGKYDGLDATRLQLPFSQKIVRMAYEVNDVWIDIADKLEGKVYDLDGLIPSVDKSLETVQDRENNPEVTEIGIKKLTYYDDPVVEEKTPEECLSEIIGKSEHQTTLSKINQIVLKAKNRIVAFFRGNQSPYKSEELR